MIVLAQFLGRNLLSQNLCNLSLFWRSEGAGVQQVQTGDGSRGSSRSHHPPHPPPTTLPPSSNSTSRPNEDKIAGSVATQL